MLKDDTRIALFLLHNVEMLNVYIDSCKIVYNIEYDYEEYIFVKIF